MEKLRALLGRIFPAAMSDKKRILIAGPVFPPAGGVSIHLKRLFDFFSGSFDIDFADESRTIKPGIFNIRSFRPGTYIKLIFESELVFIHSGSQLLRFIHILIARLFQKPVLLTFHSYPVTRHGFAKKLESFFLARVNKIIAVNEIIAKRINLPEKTIVRHAFLPPILSMEPELPEFIRKWIDNKREEGCQLVCCNASQLVKFKGEDLYGLDLCIELARRWKLQNMKLAIVFVVSSLEKNEEYYNESAAKVISLGISDLFLLVKEPVSFVSLIRHSDIVCRPTMSDGDSLTVREAIAFSKPVVVSDAVERPEGSILFRSRDINDLEKVIAQTVNEKLDGLKKETVSFDGYYKPYEILFNELMAGKKYE